MHKATELRALVEDAHELCESPISVAHSWLQTSSFLQVMQWRRVVDSLMPIFQFARSSPIRPQRKVVFRVSALP